MFQVTVACCVSATASRSKQRRQRETHVGGDEEYADFARKRGQVSYSVFWYEKLWANGHVESAHGISACTRSI